MCSEKQIGLRTVTQEHGGPQLYLNIFWTREFARPAKSSPKWTNFMTGVLTRAKARGQRRHRWMPARDYIRTLGKCIN